ncbi:CAAX amino terminal protease family protein [Tannerella forsythia KS16]|uniref:CPBP family intramembrane glutamic endopeptidase n=1 Tax=Tannerella forsythia TaxID=28112 RepID=UPI000618D4A0|nr:CPBP family intramembrane glutamic endopeptidase [Tannerella forsythia]BAR50525.1 CAAX amino terminal protease family protein [Tannerella forsythia KS16]
MTNHLECVTAQKSQWYWYLLVIFICFMATNTVGAIPLFIILITQWIQNPKPLTDINSFSQESMMSGIDSNLYLASMAFSFVVFLAVAIWIIKMFHGRSWTEVINGTKRVRWSRFFVGLAVWGVLQVGSFAINYMTDPNNFEFRFEPVRFIFLTIITLTMIPIQSSCEEFVFRGYLAQGVASWTGSRLWALLIPSVLFALLHSPNPEVAKYGFGVMMANYFLIGLTFGLISLLDDGIELAMGAHSINNILGSMLMTYEGSALRTDALFKAKIINPGEDLLMGILFSAVFIGILAFIYKWKFGILTRRVSPPSPVFS